MHFSRVLSVGNSASKTKQCVRGTRFPFTLSSVPSLVKARTCARDPVQQHFFCIPYGVSTEAHVWHIAQEHTNLMNSRTSTITHFVEHSTRLYDCKSYILNSIYKLVTENDFVFSNLSSLWYL